MAVRCFAKCSRFLPELHHSSVIITTRSWKVSIGCRMKVGKLEDVRDSLQILSNASYREGVMDGEWLEILFCAAV